MYAKYLVLLLLQSSRLCIVSIQYAQQVLVCTSQYMNTVRQYSTRTMHTYSSSMLCIVLLQLEYVVLESYTMYTTSQQLCTLRLLQLEYSRTKYGNFSRSMDGRSVDTVYYQITSLISTLVVVVAVLEYAMIMDITLLYALTTSQYAPSCSGRSRAVGDVRGSDCSVYPYYTLSYKIYALVLLQLVEQYAFYDAY